MFSFDGKIAIVTGGARGIGKCIADKLSEAGATVCVIDILDNSYFVGDLSSKEALERFAQKVISDYGRVDFLINNAAPKSVGTMIVPLCRLNMEARGLFMMKRAAGLV